MRRMAPVLAMLAVGLALASGPAEAGTAERLKKLNAQLAKYSAILESSKKRQAKKDIAQRRYNQIQKKIAKLEAKRNSANGKVKRRTGPKPGPSGDVMDAAVRNSRDSASGDSTVSAPRGKQVGNRFVTQEELERWKKCGLTVEHELRRQAWEAYWTSFNGMSQRDAIFWANQRAVEEMKRRYPDHEELLKNWDREYLGLMNKYADQMRDDLQRDPSLVSRYAAQLHEYLRPARERAARERQQ
jgi:hypothetical protein